MNRIAKEDLHIIFEGPTENVFLSRLEELFPTKVNIIKKNAEGADNIIKKYKNIKKKNVYSNVVVMYDLDGLKNVDDIIKLYKKEDINLESGKIYFMNPKFELIFVLCKKSETPISNYKHHIKKIYGIDNYEKTNKQLNKIVSQISNQDFEKMLGRIKTLLSHNDKENRSTNYDKLFMKVFIVKEKSRTEECVC